jgi:hypothetical protein
MAISTYPITLKYDSSASETPKWTDVCDIKDFPDLGGAPEMLETTTLSDSAKSYIAGIKDQQALEFTANYDEDDMDTIAGLTGTKKFQLWFGANGASGKFEFSGTISAYVVGAGVNDVVDMKIVIVPSTVITVVA